MTSGAGVAAIKQADARPSPTFADAVTVLSAKGAGPAGGGIIRAGDAPESGVADLKPLPTQAYVPVHRGFL